MVAHDYNSFRKFLDDFQEIKSMQSLEEFLFGHLSSYSLYNLDYKEKPYYVQRFVHNDTLELF